MKHISKTIFVGIICTLTIILNAHTASAGPDEDGKSSARIEKAVSAMFATKHLVIDGKIAYYKKDYKRALELFQKAAAKDNAEAQLYMGMVNEFGRGKPKSPTQAAQWFQKSAAQGNDSAQFFLGNAYFDGKGVPKSNEKAAHWYQKSADQGNLRAMHNLGIRYYYGEGVTQSDTEAIRWFKKAAAKDFQGSKDVLKQLGAE